MTTWLDMKDAPRDGTEVLLCTVGGQRIVCRYDEGPYPWSSTGVGWSESTMIGFVIMPDAITKEDV
jgi:hypothetical protein